MKNINKNKEIKLKNLIENIIGDHVLNSDEINEKDFKNLTKRISNAKLSANYTSANPGCQAQAGC